MSRLREFHVQYSRRSRELFRRRARESPVGGHVTRMRGWALSEYINPTDRSGSDGRMGRTRSNKRGGGGWMDVDGRVAGRKKEKKRKKAPFEVYSLCL